jgi:hypothetical protein
MLSVVNVVSEEFAKYVQELVVRCLCTVSDGAAHWFKECWTGARGRYCLCHAMHCKTNNNRRFEVDWQDLKKFCPPIATLATFLGLLVH